MAFPGRDDSVPVTVPLHPEVIALFQISEEAIAFAAFHLGEDGTRAGDVVRIVAHDNGIVLTRGRIEPGDITFSHDGHVVIAVSGELEDELRNVVLQAEQTADGTRLQLREGG